RMENKMLFSVSMVKIYSNFPTVILHIREVFDEAMSSYSSIQTTWVSEALDGYDFSNVNYVCDVGGGQGHLLCSLLVKYPHLKGTVLELDSTIKNKEHLWA